MIQADKAWQAALGELQLQVSKANYDTWLRDTKGLDCSADLFIVAVPTAFIAEWLKNRLRPVVARILSTIVGRTVDVTFQVEAAAEAVQPRPGLMPDGGTSLKTRSAPVKSGALNPRHTFLSFVAGDCNRLPYTAAMEIASNPGLTFNPLYIYGGTGTGKTHLLHAIGHAARSHEISAVYINAEQFTNEFVTAVRTRTAEEFRYKFSGADMLLIDDIQFLSSKTQTQECILHVLNDLLDNGKQVVVVSDRPPREIPSLNVRLMSRLEGGLVADINPPDHKTRLAILELKAKAMNAEFDGQVLNFVATHFYRSVRELEGALTKLATFARLNGAVPTVDLCKRLLEDMISVSKQNTGYYPASAVIGAVADYYGMAPDDITGKRRDVKTTRARHIAMYILRLQNHCNLSDIGKALGGRNHSTVIYACEKISREISVNAQLSKSVEDIRLLLRSASAS